MLYIIVLCGELFQAREISHIGLFPHWLGKASGERGWRAGPTSMDKFSSGKSGLHCTQTAMRLALAETPSP